jgi:microcystin-dependent protein
MSEIKIMSFIYAPRGWALCNGQFLPINQNQALFSLLGTTYGGNGQTTFALPDLRGMTPIHSGQGFILGQKGGEQSHTITQSEMPQHLHILQASTQNGNAPVPFGPAGNILATSVSAANPPTAVPIYGPPQGLTTMNPGSVTNVGGSQAHLNMQPFLTLSFCIALQGIFPSPN